MKELIKRIEGCNLCEAARFESLVIDTKSKPCLEFKIYEKMGSRRGEVFTYRGVPTGERFLLRPSSGEHPQEEHLQPFGDR